jgi:outer membrane lipoprotein-sorting protein
MKKICSIFILSFFLVVLMTSPGSGQTAEEIIKKMIEVQGGKKVFESIKDMTLSGNLDLVQQGLSGSITIYKKEPDKMRRDIEIMGMIITQAYDGETAWGVNIQTGKTEEMEEQQAADIKRQSLPTIAMLYPEKYGFSFDYKRNEKIEDKDYFVIEFTYPDGFKATLHVDTETYLTYKASAKTMGPMGYDVQSEQFTSDYKKVDGMIIAHSMVQFIEGEEFMKITFTSVKFNTGLEDSFFKMNQ